MAASRGKRHSSRSRHASRGKLPSASENTPTRNYNLRSMRAWRRAGFEASYSSAPCDQHRVIKRRHALRAWPKPCACVHDTQSYTRCVACVRRLWIVWGRPIAITPLEWKDEVENKQWTYGYNVSRKINLRLKRQ